MEIVKRGVPRAERPWLGTCCNCGSVLRAKAAELEMLHWVKQEKEQGKALCPVCNYVVYFSPEEAP